MSSINFKTHVLAWLHLQDISILSKASIFIKKADIEMKAEFSKSIQCLTLPLHGICGSVFKEAHYLKWWEKHLWMLSYFENPGDEV